MILKLNEEQKGLKLIQIQNSLLVTNLNYVKEDEWFVLGDEVFQNCSLHTDELCKSKQDKVIFASEDLNLEGVQVLVEGVIRGINSNTLILFDNTAKELKRDDIEYSNIITGMHFGYHQAQQTMYTEEQVREAFDRGEWDGCGKSEITRNNIFNELIESLKQPKVEITFENDKPIKCIKL